MLEHKQRLHIVSEIVSSYSDAFGAFATLPRLGSRNHHYKSGFAQGLRCILFHPKVPQWSLERKDNLCISVIYLALGNIVRLWSNGDTYSSCDSRILPWRLRWLQFTLRGQIKYPREALATLIWTVLCPGCHCLRKILSSCTLRGLWAELLTGPW